MRGARTINLQGGAGSRPGGWASTTPPCSKCPASGLPGPRTSLLEALHGLDVCRGPNHGGVGPAVATYRHAPFTLPAPQLRQQIRLPAHRPGLLGLGEAAIDAALRENELPGEHRARPQLPQVGSSA